MTTSDSLDKELGKDGITDVLGDYLDETESVVMNLIQAYPELAGNEAPEVMDVDEQPLPEPATETQEV